MALSHLLQAKQRFQLHTIGFPKPIRWCSSLKGENDKSSKQSNAGRAKEQKQMAVESYVKKYMEGHPGEFPKATHVRNEVGGSWYTMKDILQNLKEKIMGNPQPQIHPNSDASTSIDDPAASTVITSHSNSPDKTELAESKSTHILSETSSENMMDSEASEARTYGNSENAEFNEPKSLVQSLQSAVDSEDIVHLGSVSESSKLVEPEDKNRLSEELSDMGLNYDKEISKAEQFSSLKNLLTSTLEKVSEHKLHSTRCTNLAGSKMTTLGSKTGTQKVTGLADIFREKRNDQPSVEHKNGHTRSDLTLQDILSSCGTDLNSKSEEFSSLNPFTLTEMTSNLQETSANKPASSGYENYQFEVSEMSGYSHGAQDIKRLTDIFMKKMDIQNAGEVTKTKSNILTPNRLSEDLKETKGEFAAKSFDIRGLIDCIKELPRENFDNKERHASLNNHTGGKKSEKDKGGDLNFAPTHSMKSKSSQRSPLPSTAKDLNRNQDAFSTDKVLEQNKVIVRFLPNAVEESDVVKAFENCGDITMTELSHSERSSFRFAYIYFKTKEGMQRALRKTDWMVRNARVTVAVSSSLDNVSNRISIPNLIGDPDAPAALVKNPTRTVMIKQLTRDICSHHIEEALASSSSISSFFLGSMSSVAYVEFETEDGKERALAKHTISVLGKQLSIFRIDMPRTTVVRISNIHSDDALRKLNSICKYCGEVLSVKLRMKGVIDVQFKLCEWPNMLMILNRLNGMQIDGYQLIAQPATKFPPEVLSVLWSQPDGRRHVKAVMHSLLHNLGENAVHEAGLTDPAVKVYAHEL